MHVMKHRTQCFVFSISLAAVILTVHYHSPRYRQNDAFPTYLEHLDNFGRVSMTFPSNFFNATEPDRRFISQLRFVEKFSETFTARRNKTIFYKPHSNYGDPAPEGASYFQSCLIKSCSVTQDIGKYRSADAVFIQSYGGIDNWRLLPKPSHQIWMINIYESPVLNREMGLINFKRLNGLINWTITYRMDSTFPTPYGYFETFENFTRIEDYKTTVNHAAGKTKMAAWIVSNCHPDSRREEYVKFLAKYISVDVYGKCGNLRCSHGECEEFLKRDYKFYFSFENSICRSYVTEKFFKALKNNVIPVVFGTSKEDYNLIAPPGSYIHTADFETPRHLADYLNLLDNNTELYEEYFRWRATGKFMQYPSSLCTACAMLHVNDELKYVNWYEDIVKWWEGGTVCKQFQ